jgi:polyisoprenoid-binding protein YceI
MHWTENGIGIFKNVSRHKFRFAVLLVFACVPVFAIAQDVALPVDPARSTVTWTLSDVLHTVHGTFTLQRGSLRLDPASGRMSGEIIVDAKSGESGNGSRDRKMHKEVLESEQYPEISFRPDQVDGTVALQGKSSVKVHGMFNIHGADREIDVPAEVEMAADHWTATVHFTVPYAKWGMKNPSTLFLRVSDSVEIDLTATGNLAKPQ